VFVSPTTWLARLAADATAMRSASAADDFARLFLLLPLPVFLCSQSHSPSLAAPSWSQPFSPQTVTSCLACCPLFRRNTLMHIARTFLCLWTRRQYGHTMTGRQADRSTSSSPLHLVRRQALSSFPPFLKRAHETRFLGTQKGTLSLKTSSQNSF